MTRVKKSLFFSLIFLIGILFLLGAFLPTFLSSGLGKKCIIQLVESSTGANISIENLSLSWFGKQEITELFFDDSKGSEIRCDQILSEASLAKLLIGKGDIGTLFIKSPQAKVQLTSPKKAPKNSIEKKGSGKRIKRFYPNVKGQLVIDDGAIQFKDTEKTLVSVHQVDLNLQFPLQLSSLSFKAQGKTQQEDLYGYFKFEIQQGRKCIEGTAAITNFPIAGLDQLFGMFCPSQKGLILAAIGDTLNFHGAIVPNDNNLQIEIDLRSPQLLLNLNAEYQNSLLSLQKEGRVKWTINPEFINPLNETFELKNSAQLEMLFESLSIPLKEDHFQWKKLTAKGNLSFHRGSLCLKESQKEIFLNEFNSAFQTTQLSESLKLSINSMMRYGTSPETQIQGMFVLKNPLNRPRFSFSDIDINLQNFPVALLDLWKKTEYESSFGSTINSTILSSKEHLLVSVSTPLLKVPPFKILISDQVELITPISISYILTPSVYPSLEYPITLNGSLSQLTIPIQKQELCWKDLGVKGTLKTQDVALKDLFSLGSVELPFMNLDIKASSLDQVEFNGTTRLDFLNDTCGLCLLGKQVKVRSSGKLKWKNELKISPFLVQLDGKSVKTQGEGIFEKNTVILSKPLQVHLVLDPDQINPLFSQQTLFPLLSRPTLMLWEIKPTSLHLNDPSFSSLELKSTGSIANLMLNTPLNGKPLKLENIQVGITLNNKKSSQLLQFETKVIEDGNPSGSIELEVQSTGTLPYIFRSPKNMNIQFNAVSTQIVDAFCQTQGSLPDMIGPYMNLSYQLTSLGDKKNIDLLINSRDLSLKGSFIMGTKLELRSPKTPIKLHWDISEKGALAFQQWQKPDLAPISPFEVLGKASLKIEISPLVIPIKTSEEGFPKLDWNFLSTLFNANIHLSQLKLKQRSTSSSTELQQFDLEMSKKTLGNSPLSFKFEGHLGSLPNSQKGYLKGEGKLENFLSSQGALDLNNTTSHIHTNIKNLPSIYIDAFSLNSPSAFLGNLVNATLDANIQNNQGYFNLNLDSSACQTTINANIENGLLSFSKPLQATFVVTPELNRILEKSANLSVVSVKTPFLLRIQNAGLTFPLKNLKIQEISFPKGELDLGKIVCKNTGNTSALNQLFQNSKTGNTSFWFAPIHFKMNRGKMFLDRTEVLYNHAYQVCLWGGIDFAKRHVNMTLGLTGQALSSALGISNIKPSYILKVPIKGFFGHVNIDTGSAAGKIALLLARKQVAPKKGVWGQVFGAIGDLTDDQSNIHPPKTPFPWQSTQ